MSTDKTQILEEQLMFYKKLYTAQETIGIELNQEIQKPESVIKLTGEEQEVCEGPLTETEISAVIKTFKNNKSPGTDGLPIEFYKVFWNEIKDLLINSINFAYENGNLSISQRQGLITLLPKKDKDPLNLKNWRPISLLNTDSKIVTKCLSHRMRRVLPKIIEQDQTGFLHNR